MKTKGKGQGVKAFEQRDLVALAFAGGNVVQARPVHAPHRATVNRDTEGNKKSKQRRPYAAWLGLSVAFNPETVAYG
jgi:U3 small nucleolar RNA-associated protein 14